MGMTQGNTVQMGFRPTGEPCGESLTWRFSVMVRNAFPPFPNKKKKLITTETDHQEHQALASEDKLPKQWNSQATSNCRASRLGLHSQPDPDRPAHHHINFSSSLFDAIMITGSTQHKQQYFCIYPRYICHSITRPRMPLCSIFCLV